MYNIAIDGQILDHTMGGVSTYLAALVHALGKLDGPENYKIVCAEENPEWLRSYIGNNQELVVGPRKYSRNIIKRLFGKNWLRIWAFGYHMMGSAYNSISQNGNKAIGAVVDMTGFYEKLGVKMVHVFHQTYIKTQLPVVFNPHDLQHEHFPDFFRPEVLARRKLSYKLACQTATMIVAASQYTKNDVILQYKIPPEKIKVIPFAPATIANKEVDEEIINLVKSKYQLIQPYIFYPAATWEHKNHMSLLQAVLKLKNEGIKINLICTGRQIDPIWSKIYSFIEDNNLSDQVKFLGYLSGQEIRAIYKLSHFVIAPSLFEQASGPMVEAWQEGVAVAVSNVTSIPEQAENAALLFDPTSIDEISDAIKTLWQDDNYRKDLQTRGINRLKSFNWETTSKMYRALYRFVCQEPMTEEDIDYFTRMSK